MLDIPNSLKQFGNLLKGDALYTLRNPLHSHIYYIGRSINSDVGKFLLLSFPVNLVAKRRNIIELIIRYPKWSKY
jgi:hypothetical protein